MSDLPLLKTGAAAQYPLSRSLQCSTQLLRFVDGTEQRFRDFPTPLRRWTMGLAMLDEEEMGRLEDFVLTEQGASGAFSYTDPEDGAAYADSSLDGESIELEYDEPGRVGTTIVIRENRS